MRWDFTQIHLRSQGHRLLGGRTAQIRKNATAASKRSVSHFCARGGGTVEGPVFRFGAEFVLAILDSNRCSGTYSAYSRLKLVIYKNLHARILPEIENS